jgi:hypothetical protein
MKACILANALETTFKANSIVTKSGVDCNTNDGYNKRVECTGAKISKD